MADYSLIQNENLRRLVMASEALQTLSEAEAQNMIAKICNLIPEGEQKFMEALMQEQQEVEAAKMAAAQDILPKDPQKTAQAKAELGQAKLKLQTISRGFDNAVRGFREEKVHMEDDKKAEDLLKLLDTL